MANQETVATGHHLSESQLVAFLNDDLEEHEQEQVSLHLEHCQACTESLADLCKAKDELATRLMAVREHPLLQRQAEHQQQFDLAIASGSERYELIERLAQGGMGEVFRSYDHLLDREVAIKFVHPSKSNVANIRKRFANEARICAKLQHPGVIPVYDLGTMGPDDRPFIAMKLVRGKTMSDVLREKDPGDSQAALRIFAQVCQTMAFAHSCGVVHRDLKPDNIMAGSFGEVYVMDWGLAKEIVDGLPTDLVGGFHLNASDRSFEQGDPERLTYFGMIMGTPGYMSPEQARGDRAAVSMQSDVFALGAILKEILTGESLNFGVRTTSKMRRGSESDFRQACEDLQRCNCDEQLIDLAIRCIAPEPSARPIDAGAVSRELDRCFEASDQRTRQAEVDRNIALVQLQAANRHRSITVALASTVVLLVMVTAVTSFWAQYQRRQRAAEKRVAIAKLIEHSESASILARSAETIEAEQQAWRRAQNLIRQAASDARTSTPDIQRQIDMVRYRIERESTAANHRAQLSREANSIREKLDEVFALRTKLNPTENRIGVRGSSLLRTQEQVLESCGVSIGITEIKFAAERILRHDAALQHELIVFLNRWLVSDQSMMEDSQNDWLSSLIETVDADPFRAEIRRAMRPVPDLETLTKLSRREDILEEEVENLVLLCGTLRESAAGKDLMPRAVRRYPESFWLNLWLARQSTDLDDRLRYYTACTAILPENAGLRHDVGVILSKLERTDEAILNFREAVRISPNYRSALVGIADLLVDEYETRPEAIEHYQKAFLASPPPHARLSLKLGTAYYLHRDFPKAADHLSQGLTRIKHFRNLNREYAILITSCMESGRHEDALRFAEHVCELSPDDVNLAVLKARTLMIMGRYPEAHATLSKLCESHPQDPEVLGCLGEYHLASGNHHRAVEILNPIRETSLRVRLTLSKAYQNLSQLDRAIDTLKEIDWKGGHPPEWQCKVGKQLMDLHEFTLAAKHLSVGHEGRYGNSWSLPSEKWLAECERAVRTAE